MLDHTRKLLTNIYGSVGFARLGAIHLDEYSLEGLQKKTMHQATTRYDEFERF